MLKLLNFLLCVEVLKAKAPIGAETFYTRCFLLLAKTDLHWFCGKIYHLDFQLCFFGDVERRLDLDGDELPALE